MRRTAQSPSIEGLAARLGHAETAVIARSAAQAKGSAAGTAAWDRDADLTLLFERYRSGVFAYCRRHLGSDEDAEDAVQTTFIHALRSLRNGVRPQLEVPWLLAIARNVCRERWRVTYRRRSFELVRDADDLTDVPAAVQRDELFGLDDALAHLTDQQRRALLLRDWRGLTYTEIAEQLGLSEAAVETVLFRARRAVAAELEHGPRERDRSLRGRLRTLLTPLQWLGRVGAGGKLAAGTAVVSVAVFAGGTAPPSSTAPPARTAGATSLRAVRSPAVVPARVLHASDKRAGAPHRPRQLVHRSPPVARVAAPAASTSAVVAPAPAPAAAAPASPPSTTSPPADSTPPADKPPAVPVPEPAAPVVSAELPPENAEVPPVTLQTPAVQLPQPLPSIPPLTVQTPAIQATIPTTTAQVTVPALSSVTAAVKLPPILP